MAEDSNVLLARIAEHAERYDEMADYMKARAETGVPLSSVEREMFSAAFKNALSERRHAVRVAVQIEMQQEPESWQSSCARGYRSKVETELQEICSKAIRLLEEKLLPTCEPGQAKVFYLKMAGDYFRYLAEFQTGVAKDTAANSAKSYYSSGMEEASQLGSLDQVRLGLALNFSVFQHEVLKNTAEAVQTATDALRAAQMDAASQEETPDAALTLNLLQDNLALWMPEA
eukprot:TRINITY_DN63174_c0_g1_i1.p1 TRINITY_DN63174_c0_g1~~TRINITY_DN63174_c0_g1_i1.p1  ORF type:complete len:230 (+),score=65.30 TRINITY_DN63174_c0_g1_i1:97-786(+)